jgi:hypothetical protein
MCGGALSPAASKSAKVVPFASGEGFSLSASLAAVSPETARLWNRARNAGLTPKDVTAHSRLRVCWKCPRGPDHEWRATVADCVDATKKCPACVGRQVSVTNSLAARFPDVAAQWHPTKNGPLTPELVTARTLPRVRQTWRERYLPSLGPSADRTTPTTQ